MEIYLKKCLPYILLLLSSSVFATEQYDSCKNWLKWFKPACVRLDKIWTEGDNELYLTGYAWHNRFTYDSSHIRRYNEEAWGGGLGKGMFDEKGNWHGIYAFAFLDSHKNLEPILGYAYLKMLTLNEDIRLGAGLTAFLTARPDINNNIPFPGVLPWASLGIKKVTLNATYIPGRRNIGNVLFLLVKYTF